MCDIEFEPCDVWHEQPVKARKQHKCDCCNGRIEKSHTYIKHFSKFDGEITSEKICMMCESDREVFAKHHDHMRPSPGGTKELVQECMSDSYGWKERLLWARMLRRIDERRTEGLEAKS